MPKTRQSAPTVHPSSSSSPSTASSPLKTSPTAGLPYSSALSRPSGHPQPVAKRLASRIREGRLTQGEKLELKREKNRNKQRAYRDRVTTQMEVLDEKNRSLETLLTAQVALIVNLKAENERLEGRRRDKKEKAASENPSSAFREQEEVVETQEEQERGGRAASVLLGSSTSSLSPLPSDYESAIDVEQEQQPPLLQKKRKQERPPPAQHLVFIPDDGSPAVDLIATREKDDKEDGSRGGTSEDVEMNGPRDGRDQEVQFVKDEWSFEELEDEPNNNNTTTTMDPHNLHHTSPSTSSNTFAYLENDDGDFYFTDSPSSSYSSLPFDFLDASSSSAPVDPSSPALARPYYQTLDTNDYPSSFYQPQAQRGYAPSVFISAISHRHQQQHSPAPWTPPASRPSHQTYYDSYSSPIPAPLPRLPLLPSAHRPTTPIRSRTRFQQAGYTTTTSISPRSVITTSNVQRVEERAWEPLMDTDGDGDDASRRPEWRKGGRGMLTRNRGRMGYQYC